MKNIQIQEKKYILYFLSILEISYLVFLIIFRSRYLDGYFINDLHDTEMDFFNMLALIGTGNPYNYSANYPALCFLILKIFYHLVPYDIVYSENGIQGVFLRQYMPTQLAYTICIFISIFVIYKLMKYMQKEEENLMLQFVIFFSGPMLFTIERGNFVLLAFIMTWFYVLFYDNDDFKIRVFAYLALAIAAGIKIYPALFGVLTVSSRRRRETGLLISMGILVFVMPFFEFGGIADIKEMLQGIVISSEMQGKMGMAYNFSLSNILKICQSIFVLDFSDRFLILIKGIVILICIYIFNSTSEIWKRTLSIIFIMIWMPQFSYTYTLIFLIIPFLFLFCKNKYKQIDYFYLILLGLILVPYALPKLSQYDIEEAKYPLTLPTLIINCLMLLLFVLSFVDSIVERGKRK